MSLLGIDLGTSNCKCVAFREDGKVLAQASVSYTPCTPQPDRMEIDAEVFWDAFVKTVRTVSALMDEDPVVALAVSSQGETIIPVDKEGNCVGPAIMNGDNRAREPNGAGTGAAAYLQHYRPAAGYHLWRNQNDVGTPKPAGFVRQNRQISFL